MAPLPRWSDSVLRAGLVLIVGVVLGVPLLLMAWVRTADQNGVGESVDQPIEFDHRHHVRDDGIGCLYCHHDAEQTPYAGVPDTMLCMGCHNQIWNDSPQTERLRASWQRGTPIRWRRVTAVADFTYFDHSAHVSNGVGCESCHGRVDLMPAVTLVQPMHMSFCLDCHRDPTPHLRPPHEVERMGVPPDRARGALLAETLDVDPPTNCSGCHR